VAESVTVPELRRITLHREQVIREHGWRLGLVSQQNRVKGLKAVKSWMRRFGQRVNRSSPAYPQNEAPSDFLEGKTDFPKWLPTF
jgi:hypothetical protein